MSNILQRDGLTIDILNKLSYKSEIGISLKKNLHYFDRKQLIDEIIKVNEWYNTYYDRQFNNWLHKYVYKKNYENKVGCYLRELYENAKIISENNFKEALKDVLFNS